MDVTLPLASSHTLVSLQHQVPVRLHGEAAAAAASGCPDTSSTVTLSKPGSVAVKAVAEVAAREPL